MISRWGMNVSPQSHVDHSKLSTQIKRQAPDVVQEWLSMDEPSKQALARQHLENHGVPVPAGAMMATIGPLTIRQLNILLTRRRSHSISTTSRSHFRWTGESTRSGEPRRT